MSKEWSYAKHVKAVKEAGGPEAYKKMIFNSGFSKGISIMLPMCFAGCVISYKKGKQIVDFTKRKFRIVFENDADKYD